MDKIKTEKPKTTVHEVQGLCGQKWNAKEKSSCVRNAATAHTIIVVSTLIFNAEKEGQL